jgi:hypothetical protein
MQKLAGAKAIKNPMQKYIGNDFSLAETKLVRRYVIG